MLCAGDDIPEEDDDSSSSLLSKNGTRHSKDYLFYNCRGEDIFSHLEQPDGGNKNGCLPGAVTGKEISPSGDVRCRRRTESCSSTSSDLDISPIGLDDITFFRGSGYASESDSEEFHYSPTERGRFFKVVPGAKSKTKKKVDSRGQRNWRRALRLIKDRGDPWEKFGLDTLKSERGIRHRYNPLTQEWAKDECVLKMEETPFAHGAMRECFRMKKLSNFSQSSDWLRDSNNFVAKRYMVESETSRETYFQDVALQMDAKLWGEEFNRHNPPKKVDIFMMAVIELVDRPGRPLFHVEHYIDGEYVKYNSNSGFVDVHICRQTPQAFSHFTFERSGHSLVVVDIQGVGDLYTDPQIHTAAGKEYGDGNLGTRGMALFFHSHKCNQICRSLGLTEFDLSLKEKKAISKVGSDSVSSLTRVKEDEVILCESPSLFDKSDMRKFFRQRSSETWSLPEHVERDILGKRNSGPTSDCFSRDSSRYNSECEGNCMNAEEEGEYVDYTEGFTTEGEAEQHVSFSSAVLPPFRPRGDTETSTDSGFVYGQRRKKQRGITECMDDWAAEKGEGMKDLLERRSRPSCVRAEKDLLKQEEGAESILGLIHLNLAIYHENCRFDIDILDKESALFHLKAAADCGNLQGLVAISHLYTGLANDILPSLTSADAEEFEQGKLEDIGLDYMTSAARQGDLGSVLYLASAYDTGLNLGSERKACPLEALMWYEKALESGAEQPYLLHAKMAEILLREGAVRNPSRACELYTVAAESAMEDGKGKLATKYYMLAEEAGSQCEE